MIHTRTIQLFTMGMADYHIIGQAGDAATLYMDYQHNSFTIKPDGASLNNELRQDIVRIANDLLARKHGVNFAAKQ